MFFGFAGPAWRKCIARSEGAVVHRASGDAVRGDELLRYGSVCAHQGRIAAIGFGLEVRPAEPRHVQPCLPPARSERLRGGISTLHEGVLGELETQARQRSN